MATLRDSLKYDLQEGFRDTLESRTGIIGEALRNRRERQEREQETKEQVAEISASTTRLKSTGTTLGNLERSFIQISRNLQLIAKSMKAQVTVQEETDQAMEETKKPAKLAVSRQVEKVEKDDSSLFDKILDLLDGWGRGRGRKSPKRTRRGPRGSRRSGPRGGRRLPGRVPPRVPPVGGPDRAPPPRVPPTTTTPDRAPTPAPDRGPPPRVPPAAPPTPAPQAPKPPTQAPRPRVLKNKIKEAVLKRVPAALAKMGIKSVPIIGAAVGIGFAIERLVRGDPVGAGLEAVGALGSAITAIPATAVQMVRDLYIELYGIPFEQDTSPDKEQRWKDLHDVVMEVLREELRKAATKAPEPEEIDYSQVATDMMGNATGIPPPLPAPPRPPPPQPVQRPPAAARPPAPTPSPPSTPAPAPAGRPAPAAAPAAQPAGPKPAVGASVKEKAAAFSRVLDTYGITNPVGKIAIISAAGKESGLNPDRVEMGGKEWLATLNNPKHGLAYVYKHLPQLGPNGRTANRLGYPQGIPEAVLKQEFAKGNEAFFELVYGMIPKFNPEPGDGFKYRGRGFFQLTGRTVYKNVGDLIGLPLENEPDKVLSDFNTAAGAAVGYLFRTRGGRDKTVAALNSFTDVNSALKYVLHAVAGLGKDASQFDVAGSHMNAQLVKSQAYVSVAQAATSGSDVGSASTNVAAGQRAGSTQPNVTVIAAVAPSDTKKAAGVPQPRVERPAAVAAG